MSCTHFVYSMQPHSWQKYRMCSYKLNMLSPLKCARGCVYVTLAASTFTLLSIQLAHFKRVFKTVHSALGWVDTACHTGCTLLLQDSSKFWDRENEREHKLEAGARPEWWVYRQNICCALLKKKRKASSAFIPIKMGYISLNGSSLTKFCYKSAI